MADEKKADAMESNDSTVSKEKTSSASIQEVASDIIQEVLSGSIQEITSDGIQEITPNTDPSKQTELEETDASQVSSQETKAGKEGDGVTAEEQEHMMDSDAADEPSKAAGSGDGESSEWLDILGSGQLKKKVLREGRGESTRAGQGMSLTINYRGCLLDGGKEVEKQDRFSFVQGEGEIVQAIDMSACLMELGEEAEIHANSRFAYGDYGKKALIPPNADMVYTVELLEVNPPPAPISMTMEDCCQLANKKREYGNEMFVRKDFSGAINSYTRALKVLEEALIKSEDNHKKELNELLVKCYNNLAAAQLKVEAYPAALKSCNSALQSQEGNVKALFRKGKVLACQKEFTEAVIMMKKALAVEPTNKTIQQELSKLTSRRQEEVKSEKEMYQRMVGNAGLATQVPAAEAKRFGAKTVLLGLSAAIGVLAVMIALHLN